MSTTYNILCQTLSSVSRPLAESQWHKPALAETAEVDGNTIKYAGMYAETLEAGTGLSGECVTLHFNVGDVAYRLYTDTPGEGKNATPESLRESATRAMSW